MQLGLTIQALGRAWAVEGVGYVAAAPSELAELYDEQPEDLVVEAARLQGLLALPWDDDLGRLACAPGARTGRVVLDEATYACYQRVRDRILAIWRTGSPLIRYADRRTSFP